MNVLVLGGYGLVGRPIVSRLISHGHRVTGIGRSVRSPRHSCPEATWVSQDIAQLTDPVKWLPLLSDIEAVVNCAGALQDSVRDDLEALQSRAMRALFQACAIAQVRLVVQISAAGVSLNAATAFFRTKAEADTALTASDLDWVILRPGLVISQAAYGGTALIRALASFPFFTPMPSGMQTIQTVSAEDVAEAVLATLERRVRLRRVYDLVERKPHTLDDVVRAFRAWMGYPPVPVLRVPVSLVHMAFRLGDLIGYLGWRSPLRTTALVQLSEGVLGDPTAWAQERKSELGSLAATLNRFPASVQDRWFGRLWLLKPLIIATLSLFWLTSGTVGLLERERAAALMVSKGVRAELALVAVIAGSILDIGLGLSVVVRSMHKMALALMLITTGIYLTAGTFISPDLWLDPLGSFAKAVPCAILALVASGLAEER